MRRFEVGQVWRGGRYLRRITRIDKDIVFYEFLEDGDTVWCEGKREVSSTVFGTLLPPIMQELF